MLFKDRLLYSMTYLGCFHLSAVGPSSDSSGINMIDSIKIYCKTKENFGWPEDVHETTGQPADLHHPTPSVIATNETDVGYDPSKSEP